MLNRLLRRWTKPSPVPVVAPATPARAETMTIDLPALAQACAVTEPETLPVSVYTLFSTTGGFRYASLFRYNRITPKNLAHRKGILVVIKNCERLDFMALPFNTRKRFFALLKQETARYNGTATRQHDSVAGKAGTPLPKLTFPTPQDAAAYRDLLQDALRTIAAHVYNR